MHRIFDQKKIIIASSNQGKVKELAVLLKPFGVEAISSDILKTEAPAETGQDFIDNALIKSSYYGKMANMPALADDSGLCIDELGGAPGINSARFIDEYGGIDAAMHAIEAQLKNQHKSTSKARFVCALSLWWPDGHSENFLGVVEGHIQFPPRGNQGFGYDPIFVPLGYNQTFAEMEPARKNLISHRYKAFQQMIEFCFRING